MPSRKKTPDLRRRKPKQARARNTVDAILEAAARILQKEGEKPLTTNRVAERAGVSISTLYQYFRNKEALLVELARREMKSHGDAIAASIADSAKKGVEVDRAAIRALIDASGKRHRSRRLAIETLIAQGLSHEVTGPVQEVARVLAGHAKALMPGVATPLSPVALFVLTRAVQGVVGASLREQPSFTSSVEFETELLHLVRGYMRELAG